MYTSIKSFFSFLKKIFKLAGPAPVVVPAPSPAPVEQFTEVTEPVVVGKPAEKIEEKMVFEVLPHDATRAEIRAKYKQHGMKFNPKKKNPALIKAFNNR